MRHRIAEVIGAKWRNERRNKKGRDLDIGRNEIIGNNVRTRYENFGTKQKFYIKVLVNG